ncbi:Uncharacterised protein [Klebsiella pneumoniae]|nr:Uncharacterised protein [Klebsiella pneumoniae]
MAEGRPDEFMELLQVGFGAAGTGEDDREGQVLVVRVHEDAQQVEELFRGPGAAGEDDDPVADADEGFQALLDVREYHQFVDDRVRRLGGDDSRFGQAQVATADDALLGVADGGALHRSLHHPRSAAGADVQAAQAELMADLLGVLVFLAADRMTAPADDDLRLDAGAQRTGVAQQLEDVVGEALGTVQVDVLAVQPALGIDDVAQGAEQHLASTGDHLAIDEGVGRRVDQLQAHAAVLLVDTHLEVLVGVEDGLGVVAVGAGIEDRQGALAEQLVGLAVGGFAQLLHFALGEGFQRAFRTDRGVDHRAMRHVRFHAGDAAA